MSIDTFYADKVLIKRPEMAVTTSGAQCMGLQVVAQDVLCRIRPLSDEERDSRGIMSNVSTHRMVCAPDTDIQVRDEIWMMAESDEDDPYWTVEVKLEARTAMSVHHLELDLKRIE